MKQVVASAIMMDDRSRILLSRQKKTRLWCSPGGKVELDEFNEEGLIREVKEEIGVDVIRHHFLGFHDQSSRVVFFYLVDIWHGEIKNLEPEKHGIWIWHNWIPDGCVEGLKYFKAHLLEKVYVIKRSVA